MSKPTLYLVDDDSAIVDSVTKWMQMHDVTVRSFASADGFLSVDDIEPPGCFVIDLKMPGLSGLELQSKLRERNEQMPVIIISGHGDLESAVTAFRLGADDFMTKPFDPATLLERVERCFDADQERLHRENLAEQSKTRYESLTQRERQVFEFLVQGKVGKKIAAELGISPRTVEKFRANLMRKMEADGVAELVRAAYDAGLISTDS